MGCCQAPHRPIDSELIKASSPGGRGADAEEDAPPGSRCDRRLRKLDTVADGPSTMVAPPAGGAQRAVQAAALENTLLCSARRTSGAGVADCETGGDAEARSGLYKPPLAFQPQLFEFESFKAHDSLPSLCHEGTGEGVGESADDEPPLLDAPTTARTQSARRLLEGLQKGASSGRGQLDGLDLRVPALFSDAAARGQPGLSWSGSRNHLDDPDAEFLTTVEDERVVLAELDGDLQYHAR